MACPARSVSVAGASLALLIEAKAKAPDLSFQMASTTAAPTPPRKYLTTR